MTSTTPRAERIRQVERDLVELEEQVALGEVDAATGALLRERYETERAQLIAESDDAEEIEASGGLSGRRLVGIGFVLVAVVGLALWLVATNTDGQGGAEGIAGDALRGEATNLDDVTNEEMEAVVAQNPDIPGMRLALADRYFADGEFSDALTHYMYVLQTLEVKDPTALANVGWMTFLSDVPDLAESFVEESLAVQPDGGIAFWYLANIRFFGLGDAAGAVEPLQQLLAYDNLPDRLREEAETLLVEVEAAL